MRGLKKEETEHLEASWGEFNGTQESPKNHHTLAPLLSTQATELSEERQYQAICKKKRTETSELALKKGSDRTVGRLSPQGVGGKKVTNRGWACGNERNRPRGGQDHAKKQQESDLQQILRIRKDARYGGKKGSSVNRKIRVPSNGVFKGKEVVKRAIESLSSAKGEKHLLERD